jgi:hypothetical protein
MDNTSLIAGLTLVISNFSISMAVAKAVRSRYYMEACILAILFFASTAYHMCQAQFFCIVDVENHQIMDHFFVYSTLVWMALFLIDTQIIPKVCVFVIAQSILLPTVIKWVHSWAVPGTLIVIMLLIMIIIVSYKKSVKFDTLDLVAALVLVLAGSFFFVWAGEPGEPRYPYAHSLWHDFSMTSLYFVIEIRDGQSVIYKFIESMKSSSY